MNLTTSRAPRAIPFEEVCAHNVRASLGKAIHPVVRHESAIGIEDHGEKHTTLVEFIASRMPEQPIEVSGEVGHGMRNVTLLSLREVILLLDRIPVMHE